MSNNHYESVVVINATLDDQVIDEVIKKIENFIQSNEGKITASERRGRQRLAYPIKKSKSGYYFILRFIANPNLISKLERIYRLDESIFRYLTIKLTKKDLEHIQKEAKKKEAVEAQQNDEIIVTEEVSNNVEEKIESN